MFVTHTMIVGNASLTTCCKPSLSQINRRREFKKARRAFIGANQTSAIFPHAFFCFFSPFSRQSFYTCNVRMRNTMRTAAAVKTAAKAASTIVETAAPAAAAAPSR